MRLNYESIAGNDFLVYFVGSMLADRGVGVGVMACHLAAFDTFSDRADFYRSFPGFNKKYLIPASTIIGLEGKEESKKAKLKRNGNPLKAE